MTRRADDRVALRSWMVVPACGQRTNDDELLRENIG